MGLKTQKLFAYNNNTIVIQQLLCINEGEFISLKKSFRSTNRVSNSLNTNQAQHFVGPDLGPNCLQRLSVDNKSLH